MKPTPPPPEPPAPEPPHPPKVAALVVSHNREALLRRCLAALEASEARDAMEIVVVDNGSSDGSPQLESDFPNARFVRLPRNFGLTKALNIGVRTTEADYIFLLHEDTEVSPNTVRELTALLEAQSEASAACPLLVDDRGNPAPQFGNLPPDRRWRPAESPIEPVTVEYARGAALMVRSYLWKAMRQIDERYGQFGSDAEIAYQIRRAGRKTLLVPTARARHQGREEDSSLGRADFHNGVAVFLGKHNGFFSGLSYRLGAILSSLAGFRFGELMHLVSGDKIDGSQSG